jgi:hypothetical protein
MRNLLIVLAGTALLIFPSPANAQPHQVPGSAPPAAPDWGPGEAGFARAGTSWFSLGTTNSVASSGSVKFEDGETFDDPDTRDSEFFGRASYFPSDGFLIGLLLSLGQTSSNDEFVDTSSSGGDIGLELGYVFPLGETRSFFGMIRAGARVGGGEVEEKTLMSNSQHAVTELAFSRTGRNIHGAIIIPVGAHEGGTVSLGYGYGSLEMDLDIRATTPGQTPVTVSAQAERVHHGPSVSMVSSSDPVASAAS